MEREIESPLQGDILLTIFSHVPTLDLLPALHVSTSWRRAALFSISSRQRRPWLLIHQLSRRRRRRLSAAYDPHTHTWHTLPHVPPPPPITCPLLPLSLPLQPLAATWPLLPPPLTPRHDAIIALVGRHVILAGGVSHLGDRTLAVESLSLDSAFWENRDPIPVTLRDSAAATWLAVATSKTRLYVLDRGNADRARLAWFDLITGRWSPVRPVRLGCDVKHIAAIGLGPAAADGVDRLIIVGLMECELGIWELRVNDFEIRAIGALPAEAVAKIAGEGEVGLPAVGFSSVGGFGFVYNLEGRGEVVACEFGDGNWRWEGVGWPHAVEMDPSARLVFGCGELAVEDLISVCWGREDVASTVQQL